MLPFFKGEFQLCVTGRADIKDIMNHSTASGWSIKIF